MNKPTLLIVTGIQGCGKGTHCKKYIAENPNKKIKYIETGEEFRKLPDTHLFKQLINKGEMVPDEVVNEVVTNILGNLDLNNYDMIILDGFPRTLPQANYLMAVIAKKYDFKKIMVIHLAMSDKLVIKRLKERATIEKRKDDLNVQAIKTRIANFKQKTLPAIKQLGKQSTESKGAIGFKAIKIEDAPIDINFTKFKTAVNTLEATPIVLGRHHSFNAKDINLDLNDPDAVVTYLLNYYVENNITNSQELVRVLKTYKPLKTIAELQRLRLKGKEK